MTFLQANKALIEIFFEYLDYANVFLANLAIELLKHNDINDHAIKLVNSKQSCYKLIYNLGPVELEILKTYIKTHLKTRFIKLLKFFAGALILLEKKLDKNLYLFVNY